MTGAVLLPLPPPRTPLRSHVGANAALLAAARQRRAEDEENVAMDADEDEEEDEDETLSPHVDAVAAALLERFRAVADKRVSDAAVLLVSRKEREKGVFSFVFFVVLSLSPSSLSLLSLFSLFLSSSFPGHDDLDPKRQVDARKHQQQQRDCRPNPCPHPGGPQALQAQGRGLEGRSRLRADALGAALARGRGAAAAARGAAVLEARRALCCCFGGGGL